MDTKTYPVETIVQASEAIDRVETLLRAIKVVCPTAGPWDPESIASGLANEASELLFEVQKSFLAVEGGEAS